MFGENMMINDLGRLIYESPSSKLLGKIGNLTFAIFMFILGFVISFGPFIFDFMEWEGVTHLGGILLFMFSFTAYYSVKKRIRIYERGFSGPTYRASYISIWPDPVHINDVVGFCVYNFIDNVYRCEILFNNGKIIKLTGRTFDKKTTKIFKHQILSQLQRLSKSTFIKHRKQIRAKRRLVSSAP